jgi:adhesin transport system outer membrane protein
MKKYVLFVFVVSSLCAQTLKDTVGEVISTNPVILERLKNYNALKEGITGAKAGYYPKVDLNLGAGHEHTDKKKSAKCFRFSLQLQCISKFT